MTYDDGLDSQLDVVAPELERRGWRGTFYITKENMEGRLEDWEKLAERGHEVEDHTATHPCDMRRFDGATFEAREIRPMEQFLKANFAEAGPHTFAYPCGYLGLGTGPKLTRYARYQRLVHRDFVAARTTAGAPNDPRVVGQERFHLHAFEPTYEADVIGPAQRYLREARAQGAWAILVFHDVVPRWRSDGDASIALHAQILDLISELGLWCAPVGSVLKRVV